MVFFVTLVLSQLRAVVPQCAGSCNPDQGGLAAAPGIAAPCANGDTLDDAVELLQQDSWILEAGARPRIPLKLFFTEKDSSLAALPGPLQENINRTIALNPDLTVHWLGDRECADYIREHFDDELLLFFEYEPRGNIRGDICRSAVLLNEGGFYVDGDVELRVPLTSLIEPSTAFMSTLSGASVMNAVLAATPNNSIIKSSMDLIREYYRGNLDSIDSGLLGPSTLWLALNSEARQCHATAITAKRRLRWCGSEDLTLLSEEPYLCLLRSPSEICPQQRVLAQSVFQGAQYALYGEMGTGSLEVVGWSRFAECRTLGCGGGGHRSSQTTSAGMPRAPPRVNILKSLRVGGVRLNVPKGTLNTVSPRLVKQLLKHRTTSPKIWFRGDAQIGW